MAIVVEGSSFVAVSAADNDFTSGASLAVHANTDLLLIAGGFEYSNGGGDVDMLTLVGDPGGLDASATLVTDGVTTATLNVHPSTSGNANSVWALTRTQLTAVLGTNIALQATRTNYGGFDDVVFGYWCLSGVAESATIKSVTLNSVVSSGTASQAVSYADGDLILSTACFGNNAATTTDASQNEDWNTIIAPGSFPDTAQHVGSDELKSGSGSDTEVHSQASDAFRIAHIVLVVAAAGAGGGAASPSPRSPYLTPLGSPLLRMRSLRRRLHKSSSGLWLGADQIGAPSP